MEQSAPEHGALASELAGHLDFMRRLARALVQDEEVAEDVVQETMLAAMRARPNPSAGLRVWLKGVLRKRVLLHFRTEQRRVARETLMLRDAAGESSAALSEAEAAMVQLERTTTIGAAVAGLSDPYRTIVVLRYFEGLTPRKIAERLDRPVHTVHTQLQRGLQRLRADLDRSHGNDRRAWICALLPQALHPQCGWWPRSVRSVAGVSYGAATVAVAVALALAVVLGGAPWRAVRGSEAPAQPSVQVAQAHSGKVGTGELPRAGASEQRSPVAPASDPRESKRTAPDLLRLRVISALGPVSGATVVATPSKSDERRSFKIKSVVEGVDGLKLLVTPGNMRFPFPREEGEDPAGTLTAVTDAAGVAELPVLSGDRWELRVEHGGFAAATTTVAHTDSKRERTVRLRPACRLVVARGDLPLEHAFAVRIESVHRRSRDLMLLEAGEQQLVAADLAPGRYFVDALTAGGVDVAHWRLPVDVHEGQVAHLNLSMGGSAEVAVDVRGAGPSVIPHFAEAVGPEGPDGLRSWSQYTPIHHGIARFKGLPAGPAEIRVLSRQQEIGRVGLEVAAGGALTTVAVDVAPGAVRVAHPGGRADGLELHLTSLAPDSPAAGALAPDGDVTRGEAILGEGESWFRGLPPGRYRLCARRGARVEVHELWVGRSVVEVELGDRDAAERSNLRIERGPGLGENALVQIATGPGAWTSLPGGASSVELPPGEYTFRAALKDMGCSLVRVRVPGDEVIVLRESSRPRSVRLRLNERGEEMELLVRAAQSSAEVADLRHTHAHVEASGEAIIELRGGAYEVIDRFGRTASFVVGPGTSEVAIELR